MLIKDVCEYLNNKYPIESAEDFDQPRIGLTIGSGNIELSGILFTLDLNIDVVNEAIEKKCNLIVSHHPYIFEPLFKVLFESEKGKVLRKMFEYNISLYSMHTNLDVGEAGVNDVLADLIGIKESNVINGESSKGNFLRFGEIEEVTLKEFATKVKENLKLTGVRVLGDLNKKIKSAGVVGGSGGKTPDMINALKCNCDCYVTGEIHLNNSQFADYNGLCLVEVNHGVEKFVFYPLKETVEKDLCLKGKVFVSELETDKMITL